MQRVAWATRFCFLDLLRPSAVVRRVPASTHPALHVACAHRALGVTPLRLMIFMKSPRPALSCVVAAS
jgi:hypothetical protein